MGKKPSLSAVPSVQPVRERRASGQHLTSRVSLPMRFGAVALLLILMGLAVMVKADLLPRRDTDLYPLHWQEATTLPAHVASFVLAQSAPNVGYACVMATARPVATPQATATSAVTPDRKPSPSPTVASSSAVFRTLDGGMNWTRLLTPFAAERACRVFVAPLDANEVVVAQPADAADESGLLPRLWRSSDGGVTWQALGPVAQSGVHAGVTALVAMGSQLVAEVTGVGVPSPPTQLYRSEDDGKTWHSLPTKLAITGLFAAGSTLYASAAGTTSDNPATSTEPLYSSTDLGNTWTPIAPPFANVSHLTFLRAADGASTYGVGLIPASTAYGAQAHAVIVSKDGGVTWSKIDAPPTLGTLSVEMLPDGTLLVESQLDATQPAGGVTAEIFRLRPGEMAWQLMGIGPYVNSWQIAEASGQAGAATRLWAVAPGPSAPTRYVWANLP